MRVQVIHLYQDKVDLESQSDQRTIFLNLESKSLIQFEKGQQPNKKVRQRHE